MTSVTRESADRTVLVYSDDPATRERMRFAIGRRPASDLGAVGFVEAATDEEVVAAVDAGLADLLVLDAEAWPAGGMGISRQLKNEVASCPPVLLVLARKVDRWLATWAQADAVVSHPLDPVDTARVAAQLLRTPAMRVPAVH